MSLRKPRHVGLNISNSDSRWGSHQRQWLIVILVTYLLVGFLCYHVILDSFFHGDDFGFLDVVKNKGAFGYFSIHPAVFFRPIISLSKYIDYKLWDLNPVGFHVTNVVFHILNSYLVFIISRYLFETTLSISKNLYLLSFCSGLLYLILPTHTEAVSWIAGRVDVIATFFFLTSFFSYLIYKDSSRLPFLLLSLLLYLFSMCSKESAIILPGIIFLYEIFDRFVHNKWTKRWTSTIYLTCIYGLVLGLYIFIRFACLRVLLGGYGSEIHLNFSLSDIISNLIVILSRSFLPFRSGDIFANLVIMICITVIMAMYYLWERRGSSRKRRDASRIVYLIIFLAGSFLISVLPVISMGWKIYYTFRERFVYLPTVFTSIFIILLIYSLRNKRSFIIPIVVCLYLSYGYSLYDTNSNWRKAGMLGKEILNQAISHEKKGTIFMVNLPDNLKGAYIYRNSFPKAYNLFNNERRSRKIVVISTHFITNEKEEVHITGENGLFHVQIEVDNPRIRFHKKRKRGKFTSDYYKIENIGKKGFTFRLSEDCINHTIMYYSAGKILRL